MKIRHVYYNKYSGQILEVLRDKRRGSAPYIDCPFEEVRGIITGEASINDFVVAYNKTSEKHILVKKDDIIRLRKLGKKSYKIPYRKKGAFDIRLVLYEKGGILEITFDPTKLSGLYNTNFRKEVKFEEGTEIRIFIKDKKGEKLQKTIVIDGQEILDKGQLIFNINDLDLKDISFYTERVFETYLWYRGKARFISPSRDQIKFDIHKADIKKRHKNFSYHLEVTKSHSGIEIRNNIEDPTLVKIFDPLEFFIVDKLDHNILYETFELDLTDLKHKVIIVPTKYKIGNDKMILYNHKYISVLLKDGEHE